MFYFYLSLILLLLFMKKCFVGIGLGMKILGNCGGFGRFGNCFYGMVVLVVLMQFATTSGPNKYETCPHNNFICNKVVSDMAEKPTKCTGLVVCYESMLTNHALDGVKYKVNTLYKIHQGKAPRICQKCVDDGKCKESSRGIKHQWNGFMVFYNMDSKAVEVVMDIAGNQAFFNLTDVRPWYFVDAFSSGGKYIDRIRDISNSDIFWENFRKEGIRLEEVLGFEVLELDLGMWNEHYALMDNREERNVHMWMETLENCEESQCPHYTKPSTYDIFGCFCGHPESNKTNENELNNFLNNTNMCCEKYYECLVKLQRNCSGLRTDKMFISIQTDKYDHYTSGMYSIHCEGDKNDFCKQGLCTCDSAVIECWTKVEPFEVSKGCTSCYLDDANDHFYGPIEQVINAREQFLPLELEVMDAAISIVAGTNTSSANQTIIRAVFEVNNAINTTKTAEKNMTSLVISTKDLIDYTYIKYKETMTTDIVAAKAYLTTLEYKKIILSFGIQLFFTEQLETIQASKNILDTVKMLEFSLFNSTEKNIKKKKT